MAEHKGGEVQDLPRETSLRGTRIYWNGHMHLATLVLRALSRSELTPQSHARFASWKAPGVERDAAAA